MKQNASLNSLSLDPADPVVDRTALRSLARRHSAYSDEVRRLLEAGLEVMRRAGTTASPRVSDIIEAASCHREAFYRHFRSKDELVAAIIEAGTNRLISYLDHQMSKEQHPRDQLGRWIQGIMAQATIPEVAEATRAVLWNGNRVRERPQAFAAHRALAELILEPITALGSSDPPRDAQVICEAVMGRMQYFLWERLTPSPADNDHLVRFCLTALATARE